jgi:exosome complex component MTR3
MSGGAFADVGTLECEVRFADRVNHNLGVGGGTDKPLERFVQTEQRMSASLKDALEPAIRSALYPKATISIYAVVMSAHGCELAALISCASLALADAFIEMDDLVCGTTIGVVKSGAARVASGTSAPRQMAVDPRTVESPNLDALLTVSMMVHRNSLTHLSVEGKISDQELVVALDTARSCCQRVRSTLDHSLMRMSSQ